MNNEPIAVIPNPQPMVKPRLLPCQCMPHEAKVRPKISITIVQ